MSESFIRLAEVSVRTGLPESTIYWWARQGKFPKSVRIGDRASAFVESEIDQWVADKIAARDAANGAQS